MWQIEQVLCTSLNDIEKIHHFGQEFEKRFFASFYTTMSSTSTSSSMRNKRRSKNMALLKACPYHGVGDRKYYIFDHWNQIVFHNQTEQKLFVSWYSGLHNKHFNENNNNVENLIYHNSSIDFRESWKYCHPAHLD